MGYSPWGHKGSDKTEQLGRRARTHTHTHTHTRQEFRRSAFGKEDSEFRKCYLISSIFSQVL